MTVDRARPTGPTNDRLEGPADLRLERRPAGLTQDPQGQGSYAVAEFQA